MAFSNRNWLIIALFCILAPLVHFYVQVFWSMHAMPAFPVSFGKSQALTMGWLLALDLLGAAFAALVIAAPLAWLVRRRPLLLALLLTIATAIATFFTWQSDSAADSRVMLLTLSELLAFFLFCWGVAVIVVRNTNRPKHATYLCAQADCAG